MAMKDTGESDEGGNESREKGMRRGENNTHDCACMTIRIKNRRKKEKGSLGDW